MKKLIAVAVALVGFTNHQSRAEDKVDFARQIRPILEQNCVKCHGPEKQKAKLRLHSKEAAMKGGKDGVIVVAGQADKSEMHRPVTFAQGDAYQLSQEGDSRASARTSLVRSWVTPGPAMP